MFNSTHDALVFAYNFRGSPRRVIFEMPQEGGLGGLDGAAQAGLIRRKVKSLGALEEAIIIAKFAPRAWECSCGASCCKGSKVNFEWHGAITEIARAIKGTKRFGQNLKMVRKYFREKISLKEVAQGQDEKESTAIFNAFRKMMKEKEQVVDIKIDDLLKDCGIIK